MDNKKEGNKTMGTRGIWGFYKDGITKATYNHWDSYPTGLGKDIKLFVATQITSELSKMFDGIIMVDSESEPTAEQITECSKYLDLGVSEKSASDWYCLLRKSQGEPQAYADGLRYMINSKDFLKESLFCEWGYILNLDTGMVEVYRGFQKAPCKTRYMAEKPTSTGSDYAYWNCALAKEIPFAEFANMDMENLEDEICQAEEDD